MKNINDKISTKFWGIVLLLVGLNLYAECQKTIVLMRHGEKKITQSYGQLNCQGENRALALPRVLNAKFGKPYAIFACNPTVTSHDGCPPNGCCDHVRPYNTSIPTAVYFGMPVISTYTNGAVGGPHSPAQANLKNCTVPPRPTTMLSLPQKPTPAKACGTGQASGDIALAKELVGNQSYCGKTVFVLWEHTEIPIVIYDLFHVLGLDAKDKIPLWPYGLCNSPECETNTCSPDYNFDSLYVVQLNQSATSASIKITLDQEGLNTNLSGKCPN